MPDPINRFLFLPLFLFLICNSVFPQIWLVSGSSSVHEKRFHRSDPLRRFKYYNGGFDLRDKHYLASAAFTGVHGYAIAGVWLLFGLAFGIFMILKCLCGGCSVPFKDCSNHCHIVLFLLILFLTSLAIVASSLVIVTNQKFLQRTEKLKDSVLGIGEEALGTLKRVIKKMKQMQYLLLPYNEQIPGNLNTTIQSFRSDARVIRRFVDTTGHTFGKAILASYIAHLVVVCINLGMLIAALVLLMLHWRPGFITIIFCCWMLTTLCWLLTGIDFFTLTFAEDACFAFEEFEQNPENSSLSSMLPCKNDSDAEKLLTRIGTTIHNFISELNTEMSEIYGILGIEKRSQKVIGIIKICEPFTGPPDYSYIPSSCPQNAIPVGDLPKLLARFTCEGGAKAEECKREGKFLPEGSYNMAHAYSRSVQDFLDIFPDLQSLARCSFVKAKISEILRHQCRTLKLAVRLFWASMLSLSIIMIVLVLAWIGRAFLCWDKFLSLCSTTPRRPT